MHAPDPVLVRSAARAGTFGPPEALGDELMEAWGEVDELDAPSLAAAFERFTDGLDIVRHSWSKRHITLAEGTVLSPARALRLALLTLDELGGTEPRSYEARIEAQPWFRAYQLVADGFRTRERLATLSRPLRWLVIDAVLDGCEFDSRVNGMQEATGWVSTGWQIDRAAKLDVEPTLVRIWRLAEQGFGANGYDDGSYEFGFDLLADDVADELLAAQLRTVHTLLAYASFPWQAYERRQLRAALTRARALDVDLDALGELCLPVIGTYFEGELPLHPEQVPND